MLYDYNHITEILMTDSDNIYTILTAIFPGKTLLANCSLSFSVSSHLKHPHRIDENSLYPKDTLGYNSPTYINRHDNVPRDSTAEVLRARCPSCCPNNSAKALKA